MRDGGYTWNDAMTDDRLHSMFAAQILRVQYVVDQFPANGRRGRWLQQVPAAPHWSGRREPQARPLRLRKQRLWKHTITWRPQLRISNARLRKYRQLLLKERSQTRTKFDEILHDVKLEYCCSLRRVRNGSHQIIRVGHWQLHDHSSRSAAQTPRKVKSGGSQP